MTQAKVLGLKMRGFDSNEAILTYMAQTLQDLGLVKASFKQAILNREEEFSTGLSIGNHGIAIPHTDIEHVNQATMAIVTLEEPVTFKQMGDNEEIPVSLVCMLALNEAHAHLEMLQKLMEFFQDEDIIERIMALSDTEENRQKILSLLAENQVI